MKREELTYWVVTGLFCAAFAFGGSGHLFRAERMVEGMSTLGYPLYVMTILGVAKLLGVAALLAPRYPLLKEWAYAGFAFDLLGALASHIFVGDPPSTWVGPVGLLIVGYRSDDYLDVLRCASIFTFLVPGSDGGCRALLEAAACGLPAVTSRRGALPEIVVDGETGLLVDEDPGALASAWQLLLDDGPRRAKLGQAARRRAEAHFDRSGFAQSLEVFYQSLK